jgi:hypothetical protein
MNELELENNKSIFNNDVLSPEMKKYSTYGTDVRPNPFGQQAKWIGPAPWTKS